MVCRGHCPAGFKSTATRRTTFSPTCRRLAPDFALFPTGWRAWSVYPTTVAKNRKVGRSGTIVPRDDTLGDGFQEEALSRQSRFAIADHDRSRGVAEGRRFGEPNRRRLVYRGTTSPPLSGRWKSAAAKRSEQRAVRRSARGRVVSS